METKLSINQVITTGILCRLRYEFAAHEGLMLNASEEDNSDMQVFNLCEGFKEIMKKTFSALEYLSEHELKTSEDVEKFTKQFDNPVISKSVDYVLANGWGKELDRA